MDWSKDISVGFEFLPDIFKYCWLLLEVERDYRNVLLICIIGGIDVICRSEDCRLSLL